MAWLRIRCLCCRTLLYFSFLHSYGHVCTVLCTSMYVCTTTSLGREGEKLAGEPSLGGKRKRCAAFTLHEKNNVHWCSPYSQSPSSPPPPIPAWMVMYSFIHHHKVSSLAARSSRSSSRLERAAAGRTGSMPPQPGYETISVK